MRPAPILGLLLAALTACGPAAPEHGLALVRIEPPAGPLFLNQKVVLVFDRPIDPASITEDTFQVLDEAGHQVPGRLRSGGFTATFVPISPRSPELGDGSFQPGRLYRLRLATFPRANAIRGAGGELLTTAGSRAWRAVSPDELPPGAPSALLPEDRGPFRLQGLRVVDGGAGIVLQLNHAVHPASLSPEAFRLLRRSGAIEIALRGARVLDRDAAAGPGFPVLLRPAFPLSPGLYSLLFETGSKGLYDAAMTPLEIPTGILSHPWQNGGSVELVVDAEDRTWPVREEFTGRPVIEDPEEAGLYLRLEGALRTGRDGLRWPDLGLRDFDSHGPFTASEPTTLLGADVPLRGQRPLGTRWDFESFHVPRGTRVVVILDRNLELRVAGSLVVDGELLFRLGGRARAEPGAPGPVVAGEPPALDDGGGPRIEVRVGGICRLTGRIGLDPAAEGMVPGRIVGDGPFFGAFDRDSRLAAWERPRTGTGDGPLEPRLLPGRWGFLGGWRRIDPPRRLAGELALDGSLDEGDLEMRVQVERPDTGPSAWVRPDVLPSLGRVRAVRVALALDGRQARSGVLLRSLMLR
ncbi:MAG: Ig-like domain-containing protein [Planctomycetota bacterium]